MWSKEEDLAEGDLKVQPRGSLGLAGEGRSLVPWRKGRREEAAESSMKEEGAESGNNREDAIGGIIGSTDEKEFGVCFQRRRRR